MPQKLQVVPAGIPAPVPAFDSDDLLPIEEVAKRLHKDVAWVREKVRRRCPNAIPCFNIGRTLVFSWVEVSNWIRETGRGVPHAKHHRSRKPKIVQKEAA